MTFATLLVVGALLGPTAQDEDDLFDDGLDALLSGEWVGEDDIGDAAGSSPLRDMKGSFELRARGFTAGRAEGNDFQHLIEGEVELEFGRTRGTSAYLRPRFRIDLADPEANRMEPYEAYVTHRGGAWDLQVGQFIENWGIVDTFNPIDVINRRDYSNGFFDPDRLGELGVRWRRFFSGGKTIGEPTVSLYAMPVFRRTLYPTEDSRFSLGSPGLPFDEDGGEVPEESEASMFAARFQSTLTSAPANADLQLLLARGPDHFPLLMASGGELVPFYFGNTTIGGGLRAVPNEDALGALLSTLTLKAEVAAKKPYLFEDSSLGPIDDYVQYVLGVDRQFPNLALDGDLLTLTVEYAGETGADDAFSLLRPFQSDVILRGLWEANDFSRTSLEARAIVDTELDEQAFEAVFEHQLRGLHEDLKLIVQLQILDFDDPAGLFSQLPDNTSVSVGLRFEF